MGDAGNGGMYVRRDVGKSDGVTMYICPVLIVPMYAQFTVSTGLNCSKSLLELE